MEDTKKSGLTCQEELKPGYSTSEVLNSPSERRIPIFFLTQGMTIDLISIRGMKEFIVVYTTLSKRRKARQLARSLLREKLVACAQIFKIDSVYRWQDELQETGEYGLLLKTMADYYPRVETRIKELHPYELPAIISLSIRDGSKEFLGWIASEISDQGQEKIA